MSATDSGLDANSLSLSNRKSFLLGHVALFMPEWLIPV